MGRRTDTASRSLQATPHTLYQAFVTADALKTWLPPQGMSCEIQAFEPRAGGAYRMVLRYESLDHATPGKTSEDADVVQGRFIELIPDKKIVWQVEFASNDPAFAGTMTMTWRFDAIPEGTRVTILCQNVPDGIRPEDHDEGLRSTLENLAAFVA